MQKWILLSVLSGIALVAVGAFAWWPMPSRVTQANHDQIEQGMSRAEVQNLLGTPGDYRTAPTYSEIIIGDRFYYNLTPDPAVFPDGADDPGMESRQKWEGDGGDAYVWFYGDRVLGKYFVFKANLKQNLFENLLWRINRF